MFQNSYQNGHYFDFFDPKVSQDKIKPLYKTSNLPANHKVFDKDLKTYVMESLTPNAKMVFPREQRKDLYLIQQYLVFQIYFFPGMSWSMELSVSDLTKTKRRVILSPATTKTELKPFFVKTLCTWKEGVWNTFVVDLYSYMEAFKGQTYRSLDSIHLSGHFKLRRIYTTSSEPEELEHEEFMSEVKPMNFLPKQFNLPMGLPSTTSINRYDNCEVSQLGEDIESSTKNSSFLKSSKTKPNTQPFSRGKVQSKKVMSRETKREVKVEEYKTEKIIIDESKDRIKAENKKRTDFLSNTNGDVLTRNRKEKERASVGKNAVSQKINRGRSNPKGKVNPWRNCQESEGGLSDASNLALSKHESYRKAVTPDNLISFKKQKTGRGSEAKQPKTRPFDCQNSDSEYVELSQKFSTFSDGKFLRSEANPLPDSKPEQQEQIQENIEFESNSIYSSCKKQQNSPEGKEQEKEKVERSNNGEYIMEFINDSLDMMQKPEKEMQMGRSSLYGFGQKLMKNYMHDNYERPYSPPLGQRESNEYGSDLKEDKIEKEQVELVFDPVLNCYYDHKTHTYYQLKN